jgi:hypothetical protein
VFSFFATLGISKYCPFFYWVLMLYSLLILMPLLTILLEKAKIKLPLVNALGHFILMNLALLIGYFKFIGASHESAWEPPKRNV